MTDFHFTTPILFAFQATAWLCAGALVGAAYFSTLNWNVRLLTFGRPPPVAAALPFGRFLLLAGILSAVADRCGTLPLIAAAAGILVTRTIMTMRLGVQR
jgi:F1F0 ATPase subunit 2